MKRKMKKKRKVVKIKKSGTLKINSLRAVNLAKSKNDLLEKFSDLKCYQTVGTNRLFKISCVRFSECPEDLFSWMMKLLEENMAELYSTCDWGWDPHSKAKEMSDGSSRFVVVRSENDVPVAFSHFRFDMDNGTCVVYCYELQVDKDARKQGLAKHVLRVLEVLCLEHNMNKVVLTVFNRNENAVAFFTSQGYTLDKTSPQNYGQDTFYSILSKPNTNI